MFLDKSVRSVTTKKQKDRKMDSINLENLRVDYYYIFSIGILLSKCRSYESIGRNKMKAIRSEN